MGKYEIPTLNYKYDELEPYIDEKTMEIHHSEIHYAYANGINETLEHINALQHKNYITSILSDLTLIPENVRKEINFFGGGFDNHRLFWESIKPHGGGEPGGNLADEIKIYFNSFKEFKEKFSNECMSIQGSGWSWLVYNQTYSRLEIKAMPDQTSPWTLRLIPLLGLDLWEHAYYWKYQDNREEYVKAWWNIINWPEIEERFSRVSS
jgi:Fe-Mn family superoxide dismutase